MTSRALIAFLFGCYFTNRLFVLAPQDNYWMVKVYYSIGQHFEGLILCAFIISLSKGRERFLSCLLFLFLSAEAFIFSVAQITMDHDAKAHEWMCGMKESGLSYIVGWPGLIQEMVIPAICLILFFTYEKRKDRKWTTRRL